VRSISFTLTAKVRVISQNRVETLTTSSSFTFNSLDANYDLYSTFLRRVDNGDYQVFCLGKTGEPRVGETLSIRLKNRFVSRPIDVTLATDPKGKVDLGKCTEISGIEVLANTSMGSRVWNLVPSLAEPAESVTSAAGQTLTIPLRSVVKASEIRLAKLVSPGGTAVALLPESVKLADDGHTLLLDLAAGSYQLEMEGSSMDIRIVEPSKEADLGDWEDDVLVDSHNVHTKEGGAVDTLRITSLTTKADKIDVTLANASSATRVHALVTSFAPFELSAVSFSLPPESTLGGNSLDFEGNSFSTSESLSEEFSYVLSRKSKGKVLGVLLRKPGVLLSTWKLRSTSLQTTKLDAPAPKPQGAQLMAKRAAPMMARDGSMDYAAAEAVSYDQYDNARGGPAMIGGVMDFNGPRGFTSDRISSTSFEDSANYGDDSVSWMSPRFLSDDACVRFPQQRGFIDYQPQARRSRPCVCSLTCGRCA